MTLEESIARIKNHKIFHKMNEPRAIYISEALEMAIKALEDEDAFENIRAEIVDTGAYEQEVNGKTEFLKGINYCLSVMDKYKIGSIEHNCKYYIHEDYPKCSYCTCPNNCIVIDKSKEREEELHKEE